MIVNNRRVQGLYLYGVGSSSIEFTKGDLVVSGDSIYVCDAESVSGIDPANDTYYEYYHPYPGSKITTASEYFQYIKNGGEDEGLNKYVSVQAIKGILQGYQFGLNMEGEIEDWIDGNGNTSLTLSSNSERPLDDLILTENLNRGIIKVSYRLNQISGGIVNGKPFSTLFGFVDKVDKDGNPIEYQIILSQYTYKQSENLYIRIQELMSPLAGVSVYRYMYWETGNFPVGGNIISSWKNVFSYSSAIQDKLDTLNTYYETLESQLNSKVASLKGSFRFKEVYIGGNSITDLSPGVYTVCLEGVVDRQSHSESVTVKLVSGMAGYDIYFCKLEGHLHLTPTTISLVSQTGTKIISAYGRDIRL